MTFWEELARFPDMVTARSFVEALADNLIAIGLSGPDFALGFGHSSEIEWRHSALKVVLSLVGKFDIIIGGRHLAVCILQSRELSSVVDVEYSLCGSRA